MARAAAEFGYIEMFDSRTPPDATFSYFSPEAPEGR